MDKNSFNFNFFEKILFIILKKYTYKVYSKGVKTGYNFNAIFNATNLKKYKKL